jgi:hypothetical protein
MPPEHVVADSVSIARELLLRQYQQIMGSWNFAGEMQWAQIAVLLTLVVGLLLLVLRDNKKAGLRPLFWTVLGLLCVFYILDWHHRDVTMRVEERAEQIESVLLANPPLSYEQLASTARAPIPPPSWKYWSESAWPGLEGVLIYCSVVGVLFLAGWKMYRSKEATMSRT